jgi:hypothetical protein
MTEGYLPEYTHHSSLRVGQWVEGAPDRRWYGLKHRDKRKFEVATYRCERCAYLESYAPDAP